MSLFRTVLMLAALAAMLVASGARADAGAPFSIERMGGAELNLPAEQEGIGIYLFWATWCPYCRSLMPHLQSLIDQHPGRLTVYALNFREREDPAAYLAEQGFDFMLLPEADTVAEAWNVRGTPALFILDREGTLCFNLYEVLTENPDGWESLGHRQRAQRRGPFWAAKVRDRLNQMLANEGRC